jgi:hypothetical protein
MVINFKESKMKERYIPAGYVQLKIENPADVVVYTNNGADNMWVGICFAGKAVKATWYYRFPNQERMLQKVQDTVKGRTVRQELVNKYKAARLAPTTLKENDILYCSWGYDQTQVDFYKVKAVLGKNRIKIVPMTAVIADQGTGADYMVAGAEKGESMLKVVNGQMNSVKITSFSNAYLWDGQPKYETAFGYGR